MSSSSISERALLPKREKLRELPPLFDVIFDDFEDKPTGERFELGKALLTRRRSAGTQAQMMAILHSRPDQMAILIPTTVYLFSFLLPCMGMMAYLGVGRTERNYMTRATKV